MPTYVSLLNFTDQGIRTVRDTLPRGPLKCAEAWGEYEPSLLDRRSLRRGPHHRGAR
jgi:hypothetical protein